MHRPPARHPAAAGADEGPRRGVHRRRRLQDQLAGHGNDPARAAATRRRPIYRYDDSDAGIDDGAVFAFVHGTDPEVFLVLESRSDEDAQGQLALHARPDDLLGRQVSAARRRSGACPSVWNKSNPQDLYHVWLHKP